MKYRPNPLLRISAAVAIVCIGSAHAADVTLTAGTYTDTQTYNNGTISGVVVFDSGADYTFDSLALPLAWNRVTLNSGASLDVAGNITTNIAGLSLNGGTLTTGGLLVGDGPNWNGSLWDGKQTIEYGDTVINGSTIIANQSNANFISKAYSPEYDWAFGNWLWINGDGATIDSNGFDIGNTMNTWGGGGLTKTGLGTLSLTASNNFTGNTNINAGVLEVTSTGKLYGGGYTASPIVTVNSGAVLKVNGWDYDSAGSLGGLDFSRDRLVVNGGTIEFTGDSNSTIGGAAGRNFTVGTGGATLKASSPSGQRWFIAENTNFGYGNLVNDNGLTLTGDGDGEIQKVIEGTGALTKTGAGKWTLSKNNSHAGGTTVNDGVLEIAGSSSGNSYIRGTVTVNSGAELRYTGSDGTGFGFNGGNKLDTIHINGGLVNSQGMAHVWGATVNMTGGELRVNAGVSSPTGDRFEWNQSTVNSLASATTSTISGRINLRGDGGYTSAVFDVQDGSAATDLLVSASITEGGSVGITKNGAGTMELTGTNTYTGETTVSAGTLALSGDGSIANSSNIIVNGTLDVSGLTAGTFTVGAGQKLSGAGTVTATGKTVSIEGTHSVGNSPGIQTITGDLSYASGSIFEWDLVSSVNADGVDTDGVAGTDFDAVSVSGTIDVASGAIFKVVLGGSALTDIQDTNNVFWNTPYGTQSWNMTEIFGQAFNSGAFTSVQTNTDVSTYGSFTISGSALTWTAVPEPTSALAGLLLTAGLLRRRR